MEENIKETRAQLEELREQPPFENRNKIIALLEDGLEDLEKREKEVRRCLQNMETISLLLPIMKKRNCNAGEAIQELRKNMRGQHG
jgi:hypothetical protein